MFGLISFQPVLFCQEPQREISLHAIEHLCFYQFLSRSLLTMVFHSFVNSSTVKVPIFFKIFNWNISEIWIHLPFPATETSHLLFTQNINPKPLASTTYCLPFSCSASYYFECETRLIYIWVCYRKWLYRLSGTCLEFYSRSLWCYTLNSLAKSPKPLSNLLYTNHNQIVKHSNSCLNTCEYLIPKLECGILQMSLSNLNFSADHQVRTTSCKIFA